MSLYCPFLFCQCPISTYVFRACLFSGFYCWWHTSTCITFYSKNTNQDFFIFIFFMHWALGRARVGFHVEAFVILILITDYWQILISHYYIQLSVYDRTTGTLSHILLFLYPSNIFTNQGLSNLFWLFYLGSLLYLPLITLKLFKYVSNLLTIGLYDEGYSRNVSCALN